MIPQQMPMPNMPPSLDSRGIVYLGGVINEMTSRDICTRIIQTNLDESLKRILLIVNTPGGSLADTLAICDVMAWSRLPVHTLGLGMVASGGFLIFIAGAKGHRTLTPNTSILSHQFSTVNFGTRSALVESRREEELMHDRMVKHMVKHTKLKTAKAVESILLKPTDTWMSGKEALRYGVCDSVSEGHAL